jgi:hypothetical protein
MSDRRFLMSRHGRALRDEHDAPRRAAGLEVEMGARRAASAYCAPIGAGKPRSAGSIISNAMAR